MRFALALFFAAIAFGAESAATEAERVAPYYPSPRAVVLEMLDAAELQPGELLVDLGSGDGRIVILAARDYGVRAVGYELEDSLVRSSRRQIDELGLSELAQIRQQDLFTAELADADVVTLYLLPRAMKRLEPILQKTLKPGARVIAHDFAFPNWKPEKTIPIDDDQELDGLPHTVYVYKR
ncbi:MAG: class I SAM-dependent methyltransferase [Acidobacteria bacterium]|nr:class I SAM-dependent methyltransferase [Acidobacteriota bacterium]